MQQSLLAETIEKAFAGELSFEEYSRQYLELGVTRISCDLIKREHRMYGTGGCLLTHSFPFESNPNVEESFDAGRLEKAISDFDSKTIAPVALIHELASSGVSSAEVYLDGKKAIYLGTQGDFYVENWDT